MKKLFIIILIFVGIVIISKTILYAINPNYKGVIFIPTDLNKVIFGTITGSTSTYVIPNQSNEFNILISRNQNLYGIATTDEFRQTKVSNYPWTPENNIYQHVLGCNTTNTCYILNSKFVSNEPDYTVYQPVSILSYRYNTQIFSTIYSFNQDLPEKVTLISKTPDQAIIASKLNYFSSALGFTQTTKYFVLNIKTGAISIENNYQPIQQAERITFDKNDLNYIFRGSEKGALTGDEKIQVWDKGFCAGGGLSGCDSKITINENQKEISSFNCHNCMVRYLGKDSEHIFLMIIDDSKVKVGKIRIKNTTNL